MDPTRARLTNQRLSGPPLATPAAVVHHLGAVQAQDYPAARWAVAQRTSSISGDAVDQALAAGTILRTHLLRPTWHLVTPADIRWLLALTAPRIHAALARNYRELGIDDALAHRAAAAMTRALEGGRQLTRLELTAALAKAGVPLDDPRRAAHLTMRAELDGVICSGGRRGQQMTYALVDERAPPAASFDRDEALAALTTRYFTGHGPATIKDFVWWSGLTAADARRGILASGPRLTSRVVDGRAFHTSASPAPVAPPPAALLLPNYDEYIVGYADRAALFHGAPVQGILFHHTLVLAGKVAGTWTRTLGKGGIALEVRAFAPLGRRALAAVAAAAERYGRFMGSPVAVRVLAATSRPGGPPPPARPRSRPRPAGRA